MDRGGDLASALLDYLRARLDERGLELPEPLTPISGGFDTRIFAFRLRGAASAFAGPLILRLLAPQHDPARVLRERVTQNTLAGLGYPAPRVLLACPDAAPLGGAFLIMERLPGASLLQAHYLNLSRVLVETQLRLHALDAETLLRAMDEEGRDSRATGGPAMSRDVITLEGHLAQLEARVARGALDGLRPALRWLLARARIVMVNRYLAGYRRRRPIDPRSLAYYEALGAMRALIRAAESRRRDEAGAANPLDASRFAETLATHFSSISGITPVLPSRRP